MKNLDINFDHIRFVVGNSWKTATLMTEKHPDSRYTWWKAVMDEISAFQSLMIHSNNSEMLEYGNLKRWWQYALDNATDFGND